MKTMTARYFVVFARLLLGAVFILAGVLKQADAWAFADSIYRFDLIPTWLINPLALTLPLVEIVAGVLTLGGRFRRPATCTLGMLCVIFNLALAQALVRHLNIDCGCFGQLGGFGTKPWPALVRNTIFFFLTLLLWRHDGRQAQTAPLTPGIPSGS